MESYHEELAGNDEFEEENTQFCEGIDDVEAFLKQMEKKSLYVSDMQAVKVPDFADEWKKDFDEAVDLNEKEKILKKSKTDKAFAKHKDEINRLEAIQNFSLTEERTIGSVDQIDKVTPIDEEVKDALLNILGNHFPPLKNHLNIFMGQTGSGKSTVSSELGLAFYEAKAEVIYLANEEDCKNIYIRTAAMSLGMPIKSPEQYSFIELTNIKQRAREICQFLKVYDDFFIKETVGILSTPEGVKGFLDRIEDYDKDRKKVKAIIFDYYQGVTSSSASSVKEYEAQEALVQILESFRNRVGIPLYVMGQLYEKKGTFQERIKGSKSIYFRATGAMELISDKKLNFTKIIIHKSRFNGQATGTELILRMSNSRLRYQREF